MDNCFRCGKKEQYLIKQIIYVDVFTHYILLCRECLKIFEEKSDSYGVCLICSQFRFFSYCRNCGDKKEVKNV